jgi:hypothetical protein
MYSLVYAKNYRYLGFQENANFFRRKLAKIAENSDHYIHCPLIHKTDRRLATATTELAELRTKVKTLEESRSAQDKAMSKLSADNKELVRESVLF